MRGAKFVAWTIFTLVAGVTVAGAPCTWESALQIEIDHASAHFGEAISAGDVDGDGFDEIVVAALGFVNVYRGSPGPSTRPGCLQPVEGSSPLVVPAGDLDLDGYGDFLVGAYRYSNGESQEGTALFYSGASTHHGSD